MLEAQDVAGGMDLLKRQSCFTVEGPGESGVTVHLDLDGDPPGISLIAGDLARGSVFGDNIKHVCLGVGGSLACENRV